MTKYRTLMLGLVAFVVLGLSVVVSPSAPLPQSSQASATSTCSLSTIAGDWAFKTEGMYSSKHKLGGNAVGVFSIDQQGNVTGRYDYAGVEGFFPAIDYVGYFTMESDCRGTSNFHDVGSTQWIVQSIAVGNGGQEMLGMFQHATDAIGAFRAIRR